MKISDEKYYEKTKKVEMQKTQRIWKMQRINIDHLYQIKTETSVGKQTEYLQTTNFENVWRNDYQKNNERKNKEEKAKKLDINIAVRK